MNGSLEELAARRTQLVNQLLDASTRAEVDAALQAAAAWTKTHPLDLEVSTAAEQAYMIQRGYATLSDAEAEVLEAELLAERAEIETKAALAARPSSSA